MMTKRSNHIPMLTKSETTNITGMLVPHLLNQKSCGTITLQRHHPVHAHQYGPDGAVVGSAYISYGLPEYQAMKNSIAYA